MYIARLICSDPECGAAVVAEARDVMELVTLVCDCGCGLEIRGLPDWVDEPPTLIAFPARHRSPADIIAA